MPQSESDAMDTPNACQICDKKSDITTVTAAEMDEMNQLKKSLEKP